MHLYQVAMRKMGRRVRDYWESPSGVQICKKVQQLLGERHTVLSACQDPSLIGNKPLSYLGRASYLIVPKGAGKTPLLDDRRIKEKYLYSGREQETAPGLTA